MVEETKKVRITAEAFEALPPDDQQLVLQGMTPTGRILMRNAVRALTLSKARDQVVGELEAATDNPLKARLKTRLAEYDASLAQIEDFAEEGEPTGNPVGVDIGAPAGVFAQPRKRAEQEG